MKVTHGPFGSRGHWLTNKDAMSRDRGPGFPHAFEPTDLRTARRGALAVEHLPLDLPTYHLLFYSPASDTRHLLQRLLLLVSTCLPPARWPQTNCRVQYKQSTSWHLRKTKTMVKRVRNVRNKGKGNRRGLAKRNLPPQVLLQFF